MAGKFYAVRKGRETGVFNSWDVCKSKITGFSGAEYKSFKTAQEAMEYVMGGQQSKPLVSYDDKERAYAYVDGSYNIHTKEYSYGAVLVHMEEEFEFSEKGTDKALADMRNVAGEILGAEVMMRICVEKGIKELDLYYDYEGIEKWCTGVWQAKKEGTMAYRDYYNTIKDKLRVNFHKVAAHTGVELNERVDQLAKRAVGII